jgi:hypothetical protein
MTYISDYKSGPFELFKQYTGTGTYTSDGTQTPDTSLDRLCGTRFRTSAGQEVALVSVGATAITYGVLCQAAAEVTAFQKLAMTVPTTYPATAGLYQVYVTNGSTVLNVNQFAGGFLVVASGTGIGQTLRIASHGPAANAAKFVVTLEDPIQTTLDATSKVSLVANPYGNAYTGIIIQPTTITAGPVGVTLYALTASTAASYNATTGKLTTAGTPQYGFIVAKGPIGCLVDSTVTNVGYPLSASTTTPGCVCVFTAAKGFVGNSLQTLTSAYVGLVFIDL